MQSADLQTSPGTYVGTNIKRSVVTCINMTTFTLWASLGVNTVWVLQV